MITTHEAPVHSLQLWRTAENACNVQLVQVLQTREHLRVHSQLRQVSYKACFEFPGLVVLMIDLHAIKAYSIPLVGAVLVAEKDEVKVGLLSDKRCIEAHECSPRVAARVQVSSTVPLKDLALERVAHYVEGEARLPHNVLQPPA
jgi:hypothetical protein